MMRRRLIAQLLFQEAARRVARIRQQWSSQIRWSQILSSQIRSSQKRKGRCAMARIDFSSLPRENPCAQCGTPIAVPEWVEAEAGRTFYLWRCRACDYRFEAVAYFDSETNREALAA
jgi:hypothetical protein